MQAPVIRAKIRICARTHMDALIVSEIADILHKHTGFKDISTLDTLHDYPNMLEFDIKEEPDERGLVFHEMLNEMVLHVPEVISGYAIVPVSAMGGSFSLYSSDKADPGEARRFAARYVASVQTELINSLSAIIHE